MSARSLCHCLVPAALLLAAAKPPDLPVDCKVTCQAEAESPAPSMSPEFTCPYLREKQAEQMAPAAEAPAPVSVLENLQRLERAAKLFRRAEHDRQEGRLETASRLYEKVRLLCPGSRYDLMATNRLQELHAREATPSSGAEEAEEQEMEPGSPEDGANGAVGTECPCGQLSALLEDCGRACGAGQYAEACEEALDLAAVTLEFGPCGLAARVLGGLEGPTPEWIERSWGLLRAAAESAGTQGRGTVKVTLKPVLPAVDHGVVNDFERILTDEESGRPAAEDTGAAEEQEDEALPPLPAPTSEPKLSDEAGQCGHP